MIVTSDDIGPADWEGQVDLRNLNIQLVKRYRGAHNIYYKGKFNEDVNKLVGCWGWSEIRREIPGQNFELDFISQDD